MKNTLLTLTLSLLPLAAAETSSAERAAAIAESDRIREREASCIALSRPLPSGGNHVVAGAGEVIHGANYLRKKLSAEEVGSPVPVPDNRVTGALNCPEARKLPDDWYDDKYKAYWAADALIPADKVRELWYGALECLWVPVSWFCDEAGEHLVIISGEAANCLHYKMYVYQWNEERKGFVRRGGYGITSRLLALIPTRVEFLAEGMRVSVLGFSQAGNSLEYRHLFRYADGDADYRFPDEEIRWKF